MAPLAIVLTPPGRGALAVVHVCGSGTLDLVGSLFRKGIADRPRAGMLSSNGEEIDEVMVRTAPGLTGEETVEITCHGGNAVVKRVLAALESAGARRAEAAELLERGVETGHLDRIRAEAHAALPDALTELAALTLEDQADGALSRAVETLRTPDDAKRLLETAPLGLALSRPRRIVIAGRSNAGKSTLFNALLEADRVIVSDEPGTTRDPVRGRTAIRQVPFELVDTAGVGAPKDELDRLSIERTRESASEADAVLYVFDAERKPEKEEMRFLETPGKRPLLPVVNKIDAGKHRPDRAAVPVSAKTGEGVDALRSAVLDLFGLKPEHVPGRAVVFTPRQERILMEASAGGSLDTTRSGLLRS